MLVEELGAEVYSFEPNPHTVKYVARNASSDTRVEAVAVSDASGEVSFYDTFTSNKSGMSSLFPDIASGTSAGTYKTISVPAITLDEYIISEKVPTIIKMDVMNADHLVLKGGRKLFTEYAPVLILRMYNTPLAAERTKKSLALLAEYGYSSYSIGEDGRLIPVDIQISSLKFASTFVFKK
jgi:FkbM family methyltransferase